MTPAEPAPWEGAVEQLHKEGRTMNTLPDHQELDRFCRELPKAVIARLPDSIEKREAERLVDVLVDLVHVARERKADR